jgi:hypothetical protein
VLPFVTAGNVMFTVFGEHTAAGFVIAKTGVVVHGTLQVVVNEGVHIPFQVIVNATT